MTEHLNENSSIPALRILAALIGWSLLGAGVSTLIAQNTVFALVNFLLGFALITIAVWGRLFERLPNRPIPKLTLFTLLAIVSLVMINEILAFVDLSLEPTPRYIFEAVFTIGLAILTGVFAYQVIKIIRIQDSSGAET